MLDIHKDISLLIERQFPDFYREEGRDFIYFVKKYYEYLEQTDTGVIYDTRRLPDYTDIDKTKDEFLKYFVNKYMNGIPLSMLADKRFIEKHILDLYRSKGSIEGIRLLFRLLYNEEIQMYIPQYDVLRPSDGKWMKDYYVEVEYRQNNNLYQGQLITGSISGAKALVETVETRIINNRPVNIFFLSNIYGAFTQHDLLFTDVLPKSSSTKVIGSVVELEVIDGGDSFKLGDVFVTTDGTGTLLKSSVIELKKNRGIIEFTLVSGGTNYSKDAIITITNATNTLGTGANVVISSFSNTYKYIYDNTSIIAPYAAVPLNSVTFGGPYTNLQNANISFTIATGLNLSNTMIGTINTIRVTNPGINYNGDVSITITDPITGSSDAIVTGKASFEDGVVSKLRVLDSGFGYKNGEELSMYLSSNTARPITVKTKYNGSGHSEGYWRNTDSFLDSDKYIHDSYYYQEYSYEIRSSRSFDKYIDVLRRISHPAGNMPFGRSVLTLDDEEPIYLVYEDIRQQTSSTISMSVLEIITSIGTTNTFTLIDTPHDKSHLIITINGAIQHTNEYNIVGKTVTLNATLTAADEVEIRHIDYDPIEIKSSMFNGDGITNSFDTGYSMLNKKYTYVTINGVIQHTDVYRIFGTSITLNTPPVSTDKVMIRTYGVKAPLVFTSDVIELITSVGDGITNIFLHSTPLGSPSEENKIFVSINGILQHITEYSINSNQIILTVPPAIGDKVEIRIVK